jgi:hypothetical protein
MRAATLHDHANLSQAGNRTSRYRQADMPTGGDISGLILPQNAGLTGQLDEGPNGNVRHRQRMAGDQL